MPESQYKYEAFISYSHKDKQWGEWLHRKLERYKIPKEIRQSSKRKKELPKRLFPIFRDREELPSSADLGGVINEALAQSRYLIVICSPNSAKSIWVNEEIRAFKAMGRENKVLSLIVDGEPNANDKPELGLEECFPEALRYCLNAEGQITDERTEPLAADLRPGMDSKKEALLRLVAGIIDVKYDHLKDREQRRRLLKACVMTSILTVITMATAGLAYWAMQERTIAKENLARVYVNKGEKERRSKNRLAALLYYTEAFKNADTGSARIGLSRVLPNVYPEFVELSSPHSVSSMAYATDEGSLFYTAGTELRRLDLATGATILLGNVRTKRRIDQNNGHYISVSPDGQTIATAAQLNTEIVLWDVSGITKTILSLGCYPSPNISFSNNNRYLAISCHDEKVIVYDLLSKKMSSLQIRPQPFSIMNNTFYETQFTPSGLIAVASRNHKKIDLYDPTNGKWVNEISMPDRIDGFKFSIFGNYLVTYIGRQIFISTLKKQGRSYIILETLKLKSPSGIKSLAIDVNGEFVAVAGEDQNIHLLSINRGVSTTLGKHMGEVNFIEFSSNANFLYSNSDSGLKSWYIYNDNELPTENTYSEREAEILASTISGHELVTNPKTNKDWLKKLPYKPRRSTLAFSPDLKTGAIMTFKEVTLFQVSPFKILIQKKHRQKNTSHRHFSMAFSPDSNHFIMPGLHNDGAIIFDLEKLTRKSLPEDDRPWVHSVAYAPQGGLIATANFNKVHLWDAKDGTLVETLRGHPDLIEVMKFAPQGNYLATASNISRRTIIIWDLKKYLPKVIIQGHTNEIFDLAFSSDGKILATSEDSGPIKIWEVSTGKKISTLDSGSFIDRKQIYFNRQDDLIAISSVFRSTTRWNLELSTPYDELLAKAQNMIKYCSSLHLDSKGNIAQRPPLEVMRDKLEGAKAGLLPWQKEGELDYVLFYQNQLEYLSKGQTQQGLE